MIYVHRHALVFAVLLALAVLSISASKPLYGSDQLPPASNQSRVGTLDLSPFGIGSEPRHPQTPPTHRSEKSARNPDTHQLHRLTNSPVGNPDTHRLTDSREPRHAPTSPTHRLAGRSNPSGNPRSGIQTSSDSPPTHRITGRRNPSRNRRSRK